MKTFTIRTKGLDNVLRNINRSSKEFARKVDNELDVAARNVASEARSRAKGSIASSIYANTSQEFRKTVGSSNPVAAYYEFGTGQFVFKGAYTFTPEEKQFAKLFYVSGKGTTKSHAALFPAFHEEIPKLMQRIRKAQFGV